jgi:hypothetical protein
MYMDKSSEIVFRSPRYFKVWQYTVSHRRLLLRSSRDVPPNTRIDVHFGAVSAMLLKPFYDGLVIRQPSEKEFGIIAEKGGPIPDGARVYILDGEYPGFVISGRVQWHEDEGTSSDPSWFGHMIGTP